MSISKADVMSLAALARLALTEGEAEGLRKDLAAMINYVSQVSAPVSAPGDPAKSDDADRAETPLRDDVVTPSLPVNEALRPSADHDDSFFRVPPVIDREEG